MAVDSQEAERCDPRQTLDNDPLAGDLELLHRPPSPWGARYGLQGQAPGPFIPTNKSWISPSFPPFGPYAATSPRDFPNHLGSRPSLLRDGIQAPVAVEADRLFSSERIQRHKLSGLRTWEAALLWDVKSYEGGNELAPGSMSSKRLRVAEDGWYPVFRKHRWIDYNVPVSHTDDVCSQNIASQDAIWSVDNPTVWDELRPCIELANRILRQAVRGPWLSSLLDSSAHETSNGDRYEMDTETGKVTGPIHSSIRRFVQVVPSRRLAPETVEDLLRTTDHLISWSFFSAPDERPAPKPYRGQTICIVDCRAPEQSGRSQISISLDVSLIKPLLQGQLSVTDKAVIQHTIGVNMVLAYGDALARNRGLAFLEVDMERDSELEWPRQYQLFFGDESVADHRGSFANSLFGAKLEFPFYQAPCGDTSRSGLQFITTAREFPIHEDTIKQLLAVGEVTGPRDFQIAPGKVHRHYSFAVPAIWQASMMNEDFWQVQVGRLGARALQVPTDVRTENLFHPAWSTKSALPTSTNCSKAKKAEEIVFEDGQGGEVLVGSRARPLSQASDSRESAALLGTRIGDRRALWDEMRKEWYADMYTDWRRLPHANLDFREDLRLLADEYFLRRSEFDEFRAHEIARRWIIAPTFLQDRDVPVTFVYNGFMLRAAGLAVMAALPARWEEKRCRRRGVVDVRRGAMTWRLSKEARGSRVPIMPFEAWWADEPTPEYVLPRRHARDTDSEVLWGRIAMLEEAMGALELYEGQVGSTDAVAGPLRAQIRYCLHVLRDEVLPDMLARREDDSLEEMGREVEDEGEDGPELGPGMWLNLFFRLADYSYSGSTDDQADLAPAKTEEPKRVLLSKRELDSLLDKKQSSRRRNSGEEVRGKRYWTVGEVANHISMVDLWVLVWDGKDFQVYDVTAAAIRMRVNHARMESYLLYTECGRLLKKDPTAVFGAKWQFAEHKGTLIRQLDEIDMALMDPADRVSWRTIGDDVYDLKDFKYESLGEMGQRLESAVSVSGPGNIMMALLWCGLQDNLSEIKRHLEPFRCGRLRRRNFTLKEMPLYTRSEVSWFVSEETGMYTIINDTMYDLTDFVDWHPGGKSVLLEHAVGKDATAIFNKMHHDPASIETSLKHLAVGKVVDAHTSGKYAEGEFTVHGHVYKLGIPGAEDYNASSFPHHLSRSAWWFSGAEVGRQVGLGNKEAMMLARYTDLIVGKRRKSIMPAMTVGELRRCSGAEDESGYNEAWIGVRGLLWGFVYSVTTLLDVVPPDLKAALLKECGKKSANREVTNWLRTYHQDRIVARLDRYGDAEDDDLDDMPWYDLRKIAAIPGRILGTRHVTPEVSSPITGVTDEITPVKRRGAVNDVETYESPPPPLPEAEEEEEDEENVSVASDGGEDGVEEGNGDGDSIRDLIEEIVRLLELEQRKHRNPALFSVAHQMVEERLLEIRKVSLWHQESLRAEAMDQLRRLHPQTPLVRVRDLEEWEEPAPGRDPVWPEEIPSTEGLPELPEVWPYGTYSMFKNMLTPEVRRLGAPRWNGVAGAGSRLGTIQELREPEDEARDERFREYLRELGIRLDERMLGDATTMAGREWNERYCGVRGADGDATPERTVEKRKRDADAEGDRPPGSSPRGKRRKVVGDGDESRESEIDSRNCGRLTIPAVTQEKARLRAHDIEMSSPGNNSMGRAFEEAVQHRPAPLKQGEVVTGDPRRNAKRRFSQSESSPDPFQQEEGGGDRSPVRRGSEGLHSKAVSPQMRYGRRKPRTGDVETPGMVRGGGSTPSGSASPQPQPRAKKRRKRENAGAEMENGVPQFQPESPRPGPVSSQQRAAGEGSPDGEGEGPWSQAEALQPIPSPPLQRRNSDEGLEREAEGTPSPFGFALPESSQPEAPRSASTEPASKMPGRPQTRTTSPKPTSQNRRKRTTTTSPPPKPPRTPRPTPEPEPEPGFALSPHRYTPPYDGLPPSEYILAKRAEEARRRAETGALWANSIWIKKSFRWWW